jgi:uncharacterized membrane protein YjgN (DUF898 family)
MSKILQAVQDNRFSFHIIIAGVIFSIAFYMYCINAAVRSTVVRNDILDEVSALQAKLSELETTYIIATSGMTMESASSLGLLEPTNKIFISVAKI